MLRLTAAAPARRLARAAPRRGYPPAPSRQRARAATRLPSSAASARGPRPCACTARAPSSETTAATSSSSSPSGVEASAPIGVWHPPPSASTSARSARSAADASAVVDDATTAWRVVSSSSRISTATMPWPGAGTQALAGSVNAIREREPEPAEPGGGEDQRVVLAGIELAQPRVEVAADWREPRAGKQPRELRDAADAARCRSTASGRAARRDPRACRRSGYSRTLTSGVVSGFRRTGNTTASRGILAGQHRRRSQARRAARPACPCCCARRDRSRRAGARLRSP